MLFRSPNNCVQRSFSSKHVPAQGRLFLQIGAGAGNKDPRSSFHDGFTDYVSRISLTDSDRIILVEPNPGNVAALEESWRNTECAQILPLAALPNGESPTDITLWYAQDDAPHFQVASHDRAHVERHYPHSVIESMTVPAIPFNELLQQVAQNRSLELLGIDVEGLDASILLSIDWAVTDFHAVSFESVHMGASENLVRTKLHGAGYVSAGVGLDINGLDSLMVRPDSAKLRLRAKAWEVERKADLHHVDGNPWKSFLYLVNWIRTRKLRN